MEDSNLRQLVDKISPGRRKIIPGTSPLHVNFSPKLVRILLLFGIIVT